VLAENISIFIAAIYEDLFIVGRFDVWSVLTSRVCDSLYSWCRNWV